MGIESYNPSAALNTVLGSIPVSEGMQRSDVSDAFRQLMSDIASGVVPVVASKAFGAKGDGTTDDTTALQAAISASTGKVLVIPPGSYKITSPLQVSTRMTIVFTGGATLLLATQNMDGIRIGDGTDPTRNAMFGTRIVAPSFSPFSGVAAFTSGSCIYRNYVGTCDIEHLNVYGAIGGVKKFWNGVYDYRVTGSDCSNALVQQVANYGLYLKGDGTTPGRTVDCNYDFARLIDVGTGIYIDQGVAGVGFFRPEVYSIAAGGWGVHINCTAGPNGQNFFFDTVDIEAQASAAGAIYLENGNKAIFNGGWVGASMGMGLRIGTGFDSCDISCNFALSKVLIEGPNNQISGGEIVGDSSTGGANGLTIKGNYTSVHAGVQIRQWLGSGIDWGGATPLGVMIGAVGFRSNGTDIASMASFALTTAPVITQGNSDKARNGYTAAATLAIPLSVGVAQVTGATAIQTIPVRGCGGRLTIQAGAGGITLNNAGNLLLSSSPLSVPAFKTVSLVCDGSNYFEDGRSF